jgi:predicted O-methyltransferase YrrM
MITEKPVSSSADQVLRQIEKAAEKEFLPIVGPHKGKILAEEVRKAKSRHVLEVGTLIGYSAILMGKALDESAEIVKIAGENILKANIPPKVKIITGDAIVVIPTLNGPFDFAFIDAEKSEYFQYLSLAEDKLRKGAVVVADNAGIFADQMRDYLDYVRNSGKYQSRYVQVDGDGLEISVKLKSLAVGRKFNIFKLTYL